MAFVFGGAEPLCNFGRGHQSSHLLLICSPELPFLVLGLLLFERGYILLDGWTPSFWQRGLWDSCFQNPSESSGALWGTFM